MMIAEKTIKTLKKLIKDLGEMEVAVPLQITKALENEKISHAVANQVLISLSRLFEDPDLQGWIEHKRRLNNLSDKIQSQPSQSGGLASMGGYGSTDKDIQSLLYDHVIEVYRLIDSGYKTVEKTAEFTDVKIEAVKYVSLACSEITTAINIAAKIGVPIKRLEEVRIICDEAYAEIRKIANKSCTLTELHKLLKQVEFLKQWKITAKPVTETDFFNIIDNKNASEEEIENLKQAIKELLARGNYAYAPNPDYNYPQPRVVPMPFAPWNGWYHNHYNNTPQGQPLINQWNGNQMVDPGMIVPANSMMQ